MSLRLRPAEREDAASIALIYNQGIEDRITTFETHMRAPEDVQTWFDGIHPMVIVSRVFVENTASRALIGSVGFREVGTYLKHGKLDGIWRDVVIVEYLIAENLT